jgi:Fe2+ transport system protein FeoA
MAVKSEQFIDCAMCGQSFDALAHVACTVHSGCNLVCCPHCGYSDINAQESRIAHFMSKIFNPTPTTQSVASSKNRFQKRRMSLQILPPGMKAKIIGLGDLPKGRQDQLLAYGVSPGRILMVKQQNPLTVVMVDHTEIALERVLAKEILVEVEAEG